jgi:prevent-host-death family protein
MASVGAFEAKTHLADLLDRVGRGEKITIARHGTTFQIPPAKQIFQLLLV